MVIAYTKKNMAYVLNKGSGVVRFTAQVNRSTIAPMEPVLLKDRIVFPTSLTLELYKHDGRLERSYPTTSSLRTNAVGASNGSRIFFGVDSRSTGRLVAVETLPGDYKAVNQKWELMDDHGASISSAPAINSGIVYVAFDDGEVYAVNQDNRQAIWATSTGQTFKTYGASRRICVRMILGSSFLRPISSSIAWTRPRDARSGVTTPAPPCARARR